ncbi:uncharacterized protein LOC123290365 [Chrysoperla carnea]|uniref:uncharacterized protein LOC123290365 n=1 Tax=Chrysoperla carnea TaxID=189513 RepID=UPI001D06AC43|nr:uncharacterized protein LOC123290365 [Chrysoperla carnea]
MLRNLNKINNLYMKNVFCSSIVKRNTSDKGTKDKKSELGYFKSKYKIFKENESDVVLDVNEEHFSYPTTKVLEEVEPIESKHQLKRGVHGVFDIEDLIDVLHEENAQDVFVSKVPTELKYVDYIVAVNGKSNRHMLALAEFVRKVYKLKRNPTDGLPKIEGKHSNEWIALDLGNIALHIFSKNARKQYDIDSLWAVGYEYDAESNKPLDAITEMLENNVEFLRKLETK